MVVGGQGGNSSDIVQMEGRGVDIDMAQEEGGGEVVDSEGVVLDGDEDTVVDDQVLEDDGFGDDELVDQLVGGWVDDADVVCIDVEGQFLIYLTDLLHRVHIADVYLQTHLAFQVHQPHYPAATHSQYQLFISYTYIYQSTVHQYLFLLFHQHSYHFIIIIYLLDIVKYYHWHFFLSIY